MYILQIKYWKVNYEFFIKKKNNLWNIYNLYADNKRNFLVFKLHFKNFMGVEWNGGKLELLPSSSI